ncbi:AMP-binding protein [Teredinibacter turnerae]|uniref:AMP-binding protein n=1 Tax=Teredinibacter turnerae TaxID=2426 RepID=UPI00048E8878|nr:AMP-binding protein [Teredinibacter turnerae]
MRVLNTKADMSKSNISKENTCRGIHGAFYYNMHANPGKTLMESAGKTYDYRTVGSQACNVISFINAHTGENECAPGWVGVFCQDRAAAVAAYMGILASSKGFVPLDPDFPGARLNDMLKRSGINLLIVDRQSLARSREVLSQLDTAIHVCVVSFESDIPESDLKDLAGTEGSTQTYHLAQDYDTSESPLEYDVASDLPAYLMFTSGSTGRPKGVAISHGNVRHFLDSVMGIYNFNESDRFSQNFALTFDLSIFDLFVPIEASATICVPSRGENIFIKKYITRNKLTVWFSVPSLVSAAQASRQLSHGIFESLRYSLFCGEPLLVGQARQWQEAAPQSVIENLYGPTEVTIACTRYRWKKTSQMLDADIVPIGSAIGNVITQVLDDNMHEVSPGQRGELVLGGDQVALGYLDDKAQQEVRFPKLATDLTAHYRTGDRVLLDPDDNKLLFIGRMDNQVQLNGYRVELSDIEVVLGNMLGGCQVIVSPRPNYTSCNRIVVFLEKQSADNRNDTDILLESRDHLPYYMVPEKIVLIDKFPQNSNGKIDRKALAELDH